MRSKEASAFSVEIGVRRLRIVDEDRPSAPADLLHAVRQPRKGREAGADRLAGDAERIRDRDRRRRVLGVVGAAERADAGDVGEGLRAGGIDAKQGGAFGEHPLRIEPLGRDADERLAPIGAARRDGAAERVVDADDGEIGRGDEALLDRRVLRDRAVPVEMVRRDVEEDADRRLQAWCEVDLKRRHLNDMDAVAGRRLERQDRSADVAAHLHVAAGLAQDVGDERRRRRLAVGAGDGDERRVGRELRALAAEQLDVADDLDACGFRQPRRPVRLGMGQRHAGREDQRRKARPVGGRRSAVSIPCACAFAIAARAVVAGDNPRPAAFQRQRCREPRAAKPEQRDGAAGEGRGGGHGAPSPRSRARAPLSRIARAASGASRA